MGSIEKGREREEHKNEWIKQQLGGLGEALCVCKTAELLCVTWRQK